MRDLSPDAVRDGRPGDGAEQRKPDRAADLLSGVEQAGGDTGVLLGHEPVWSHLKRSLVNLVKQDIGQLTALVKTRLRRMQYQPGLLEGFLAKPRLDLTLLQ